MDGPESLWDFGCRIFDGTFFDWTFGFNSAAVDSSAAVQGFDGVFNPASARGIQTGGWTFVDGLADASVLCFFWSVSSNACG